MKLAVLCAQIQKDPLCWAIKMMGSKKLLSSCVNEKAFNDDCNVLIEVTIDLISSSGDVQKVRAIIQTKAQFRPTEKNKLLLNMLSP